MGKYLQLSLSTVLKYYKRPEVQRAIVDFAKDKEIAVSYGGTGYGKRPDALMYPNDVIEAVRQKATSFHCSEELWTNPLQITTGMKVSELNSIRYGWDLILDIDCKELEYSKIAADLLVQALKHHEVNSVAVKFSGNHGFHIGVPFEAFPNNVNGVPIAELFPEGPRKIAAYLAAMIKDVLSQKLLEKDSITNLAEKSGKEVNKIVKNGKLEPFEILDIDTVLIAARHLYRMPYSLNEKSGLVSVVIPADSILSFDKQTARPEIVVPKLMFFEREKVVPNEAKKLIVQAFDFKLPDIEIPQLNNQREFEPVLDAVPEEYFPPCIQKISQGLADGKKRAMFVLINFLSSVGWSYDMVEDYLNNWNQKNTEPLRDVLIKGRLRYMKMQKKVPLPPNCDNKSYMIDMGVCTPDGFCKKIKNPANYAVAKQRMVARQTEKKPRKKKTEDIEKEDKSKDNNNSQHSQANVVSDARATS